MDVQSAEVADRPAPYLPPEMTTRHVHSWCPYCYLGWADRRVGSRCCLMLLPNGSVDAHVPAITFDRENIGAKVMRMFQPRPWELAQIIRAGMDPRQFRHPVPGLAEALRVGALANKMARSEKITYEQARPLAIAWLASIAAAANVEAMEALSDE